MRTPSSAEGQRALSPRCQRDSPEADHNAATRPHQEDKRSFTSPKAVAPGRTLASGSKPGSRPPSLDGAIDLRSTGLICASGGEFDINYGESLATVLDFGSSSEDDTAAPVSPSRSEPKARRRSATAAATTPFRSRRVIESESEDSFSDSSAPDLPTGRQAAAQSKTSAGAARASQLLITSDSSDAEMLTDQGREKLPVNKPPGDAKPTTIGLRRQRFLLNSSDESTTSNSESESILEEPSMSEGEDSLGEFIISDGELEMTDDGEEGTLTWSPGCSPAACNPSSGGSRGRDKGSPWRPSGERDKGTRPLAPHNGTGESSRAVKKQVDGTGGSAQWQWRSPETSMASTPVARATPRGTRARAPNMSQKKFAAQRQEFAEDLYRECVPGPFLLP